MKFAEENNQFRGGRGSRGRGSSRGNFNSRGRNNFSGNSGKSKEWGRDSQNFKENKNYELQNQTSKEVDPNLHPSWAAKKKAHQSFAKFEGKKIKFDDGASSTSSVTKTNHNASSQPLSKDPKLHPSWAAKQSQKASIQTFQGKKMVKACAQDARLPLQGRVA